MALKYNKMDFSEVFEDTTSVGEVPDFDIVDSVESLSYLSLPHKNRKILLIVDICGSVSVEYDMNSVEMEPHSLMVLLPGHTISNYSSTADFKGFLITASVRQFLSALPLLSRLLVCAMHFKGNSLVRLSDRELANQMLFRDLLQRKFQDGNGVYDTLVINKLIEGIFYETMNIYFNRFDVSVAPQSRRSEVLFYNFIVNIERHFAEHRTVSFYADSLCVTSKHLSTVVKEISGRTAGDWIDSYVVNEIKRLLMTTDMTIQEISCKLKFANQSFLGKYFKHHTGMSPREFRALQLEEATITKVQNSMAHKHSSVS
jgi:AraC-like DNA-binding protein